MIWAVAVLNLNAQVGSLCRSPFTRHRWGEEMKQQVVAYTPRVCLFVPFSLRGNIFQYVRSDLRGTVLAYIFQYVRS